MKTGKLSKRLSGYFALTFAAALGSGQTTSSKPVHGPVIPGQIEIPAASDAATEIPVTVVKGAKAGPVLAIIAGLEGTAYGPVTATYDLIKNLDSSQLSGTLIVVHIANLPAFLERAIYLNPTDHKSLNQVFPGKIDGTSSERIAWAITKRVIERADFVAVLDSGGMNTMLQPYVYQTVTGDATLDSKIAAMAMAFGISNIVVDRDPKRPKDLAHSVTAENTALLSGKPMLKVMCGSFGISDNRTVEAMTRGIASLMNLFELTPGRPAKTRVPVFIDHTVYVDSPATGILAPYIQRGQDVHKGDAIFAVSGFDGKNRQQVDAPVDGIILSIVSTPPINKGEPVVLIGTPRAE